MNLSREIIFILIVIAAFLILKKWCPWCNQSGMANVKYMDWA